MECEQANCRSKIGVANIIEYKPLTVIVLTNQHKQDSLTCVCNVPKEWLESLSNSLKILIDLKKAWESL